MKTRAPHPFGGTRERGIVLVIAMILLIVLSMISIASVRSASSTEVATNNARLQALSMQAAEAALRYCEDGALNFMRSKTGTFQITPEAAPATPSDPYRWQDLANWDGVASAQPSLRVLTSEDVNSSAGPHARLYKRFPECMVQYQYSPVVNLKRVVVTARGFGPDVEAVNEKRLPPKGAEVWLQSSLQID
jgi:type IV pilus assembly protein PilX